MLPRLRVLIRRVDGLRTCTSAPTLNRVSQKYSKNPSNQRSTSICQNSQCQRSFTTTRRLQNSFEFTMPDLEQAKDLIKEDKFSQAELPLERSLEVCEAVMGESNPSTISIRRLCAKIYLKQSKYNKLGKVLEKLYKSASKDKGNRAHWLETAFDWALFCQQTERYDQAARVLQEVVDAADGDHEPAVVALTRLGVNEVLSDQSRDHLARERFDKAAELAQSIAKSSTVHGKVKINTELGSLPAALIDGHRGRYLYHTKDYTRASEVMQQTIAVLEGHKAELQRDLILSELYCNYADLLETSQNDGKTADTYTRKSVEIADKYFDRDALVYRYINAVTVKAQLSTKNYFMAEGLFRRLMDLYEKQSKIVKPDQLELEVTTLFRSLVLKYKRDTEAKQLEEKINNIQAPKRTTIFTGSRDYQLYSFAVPK